MRIQQVVSFAQLMGNLINLHLRTDHLLQRKHDIVDPNVSDPAVDGIPFHRERQSPDIDTLQNHLTGELDRLIRFFTSPLPVFPAESDGSEPGDRPAQLRDASRSDPAFTTIWLARTVLGGFCLGTGEKAPLTPALADDFKMGKVVRDTVAFRAPEIPDPEDVIWLIKFLAALPPTSAGSGLTGAAGEGVAVAVAVAVTVAVAVAVPVAEGAADEAVEDAGIVPWKSTIGSSRNTVPP